MNSNRQRRRELFRLFSATCLSTAGFAAQSQHPAQAQTTAPTQPASPPAPALVDKYPVRPITLVVPQTPGGTNDIVGRVVAQKLSDITGTSVIVENRPGAGGNIGTQAVARGSKDGYTRPRFRRHQNSEKNCWALASNWPLQRPLNSQISCATTSQPGQKSSRPREQE
jgi:hypothetical protein